MHHRRKVDTAFWGLLLTILIQLAAIVWFASTLNHTVQNLNQSVAELSQTVRMLDRSQSQINARIDVLDALLRERTDTRR